jgi:hypothetical protein
MRHENVVGGIMIKTARKKYLPSETVGAVREERQNEVTL